MRRARRLAAILQFALPVASACIAPTAALAATAAPAAPVAAAPAHAPDTGVDAARPADTRILHDSARLWRQSGRDDLSRAALLKLLAKE